LKFTGVNFFKKRSKNMLTDNQAMHKQRLLNERARRQVEFDRRHVNRTRRDRADEITAAVCVVVLIAAAVVMWFFAPVFAGWLP
jgi:hypothetical protein